MVQFDNQYRQIKVKIVYYGPAIGGKTSCLQQIHKVTDPGRRTKLYSLNTASDRTLFFDLLSLNLGRIRGYRLAMQLYTVPGQVQYNATRRAVLSGADGVVFVADSQLHQRDPNIQSLENLWENLAANGLDRSTIPLVLQFNKRDLSPIMEIEEMAEALNRRQVPAFPTIAIKGQGVMEGFGAIAESTLASVADKLGVGTNQQAVRRLQQQVRIALKPYVAPEEPEPEPEKTKEGEEPAAAALLKPPPRRAADDVAIIRPEVDPPTDKPLSAEVLVQEAVRSNIAMTELNVRLDGMRRQLENKVTVLAGITEFGRAVGGEHDPTGVLRLLLKAAVQLLRVKAVAVLVVPGSGQLREAVVHGIKRDPLLHTANEAGEPLIHELVAGRKPRLIARELDGGDESLFMAAVEGAGFASAIVVPMISQDRIVGLLTTYADSDRTVLDDNDVQLASVLGSAAAMGYASAITWRRLQEVNRNLEGQVTERTREVRSSLEEVQRLNHDLSEKNRLIEDAYRELTELDQIKNELITRISHELKTPVTSLLTAAKILERYKDAPPEKGARFISIVRDEAEKLSEIIQSVVQASVLANAQEAPSRQLVPVEDLFKGAIAPLRELASAREVRLHVLIPSGLESVSCELETMEAALRAIIKNGIEFNRKGGEVRVEVRRIVHEGTPWLLLKVSDSGVGIAEQELPHVFETFWQGGNVLTGKPRGVGLGLAIAKRVVENHGGSVTLNSRTGVGTEVSVALPQNVAT